MADDRLPTQLWVDAVLKPLNAKGIFYYIHQRGDLTGGLILLKLNGLRGHVRLLSQQRNLDGVLSWGNALNSESIEERDADSYIARAKSRDPDLWVVEIEDTEMQNPFDA